MILLELFGWIAGITVVILSIYEIALKLVQIMYKTDKEDAGRIIANILSGNSYDITTDSAFYSTLLFELNNIMSESEIIDLTKYIRMNSLIQFSSNGFHCINIFLRVDEEKKEVAEKRFADVLHENLYVHGMYSAVLVDWKYYDKNIDYLQLRYATNKKDEEYILRCNEVDRLRVAKKYEPLEDEDAEIKE